MLRCLHCDELLPEGAVIQICGSNCFHFVSLRWWVRRQAFLQGLLRRDEILEKNSNFLGRNYVGPRQESLFEGGDE